MEKREKFTKNPNYQNASSTTDISEPTNYTEPDLLKNLSLTLTVHKPHGNKSDETIEAINKYFAGANYGCLLEK